MAFGSERSLLSTLGHQFEALLSILLLTLQLQLDPSLLLVLLLRELDRVLFLFLHVGEASFHVVCRFTAPIVFVTVFIQVVIFFVFGQVPVVSIMRNRRATHGDTATS